VLAFASGVKARLIAATFDSSRALLSFFVCGVGTPFHTPFAALAPRRERCSPSGCRDLVGFPEAVKGSMSFFLDS
jgi:hypothetical protein